jgi:predicted nucleic acid-binding protein
VTIGPAHILDAIAKESKHKISFRDALIVAAAESGGANILHPEDLNHGQRYGTVEISNPFRAPAH